MGTPCAHCGCDVEAHDPVTVVEGVGPGGPRAGVYCNYACLTAHVDAAGLAVGSACRLDA